MGRTVAQLVAHYYLNPPQGRKILAPIQSDATTTVIPYAQWCRLKCACCLKHGVSGVWKCEFSNITQLMMLCAPCAFADAHAKWTGFFSRKILRIDLVSTLTYQSNSQPEEDA